ncbi:MAG TPA: ribonuclease III [Candidatus Brocadiia bacterium]|nr:ribonuclease III [Candidatus Brocadiales bacterium]
MTIEKLINCQKKLSYYFKETELLKRSLTHTSCKSDYNWSNERLEFLGDAILGMIISEYLFKTFADYSEGELTKIKSVVVSQATLAKAGNRLDLKQYISVGKGLNDRNTFPRSLVANVFEALIAAIYLDGGHDAAYNFIMANLGEEIKIVCNNQHEKNYKSLLQQYSQRELGYTPTYKVLKQHGPDHVKVFDVVVVINGVEYCSGRGKSKKAAEQLAAQETLKSLAPHIILC